jgi:hypothetical protein
MSVRTAKLYVIGPFLSKPEGKFRAAREYQSSEAEI